MKIQHRQRGVILVFLVIIIAVLLGIAAFSLDLGRLLVLKTEMQNAVDSASLAGAKELDGRAGAVARAKAAALGLIQQESHFAKDKEVLSADLIEENEVRFRFYCAIENDLDADGEVKGGCSDDFPLVNEDTNDNGQLDPGEDLNNNGRLDNKAEVPFDHPDADTYVHYIEIMLNPTTQTSEASDRYTIPLFFLPALRVMGIDAPTEADTRARALAGRQYMPCRFPPLMMCEPSENGAYPALKEGDMVMIRTQGGPASAWAPGNFGFLIPAVCMGPDGKSTCGGDTKDELENQLANEDDMGCQPPYVSTYTGQKMSSSILPMNTRFGINSTSDNPAAPNIIDYPRDDSINIAGSSGEFRIGDGVWNVSDDDPGFNDPAKMDYLPGYPPALSESGYTSSYFTIGQGTFAQPRRYNHYLYEIAQGNLPGVVAGSALDTAIKSYESTNKVTVDCPANPKNNNDLAGCINLYGNPATKYAFTPVGDADRRVLYVASLKCIEQDVKGNSLNIYVPPPPAGWKKFFLTEHVGKQGTDDASYYAEYLGPASESDGNFNVVIQLYE